MKKVFIVGIGMSALTTTKEGDAAIRQSEVLFGAERMLEAYRELGKTTVATFDAGEIKDYIDNKLEDGSRCAVLVSGDTGFYSAMKKLAAALSEYDPIVLPGISSVSYFFARCRLTWQNAKLVSCHGTDVDIVGPVRRHAMTFALTGGNVSEIGQALCDAGFSKLVVYVGENLSYPDEKISVTDAQGLANGRYSSLTVLIIYNPNPDPRVRTGIPDAEFIRTTVPMTKSEVRSSVISKMNLRPTDICWDVGCGTGSVTVEMALSAYEGRVYACDKRAEAIDLTRENLSHFHIGNVTVAEGSAPEIFTEFAAPDAAFVGGSSGNMEQIVAAIYEKNPRCRFVITAVTIENAYNSVASLQKVGIEPEITQLFVAQSRKAGNLHLMMAQNPIYIICGGGRA